MKLTFLGTGTSQGVPVIGCTCEVCSSSDPRDKRLRTSALLEHEDTIICFDTGPDFRTQMLRANPDHLNAVVFTHEHRDHTAGLDDIRPFYFRQAIPMDVYGRPSCLQAIRSQFGYIFEPSPYPGVPEVRTHEIDEAPFKVGKLELTPIPVLHYKLPVLGYRIGDLAYITDANFIPDSSLEKLKGLKVLVLNALRRKDHLSHFTLTQALEIVEKLQPEQAWFTHLSHLMGTHEVVDHEIPDHVHIAYDGLSVEV